MSRSGGTLAVVKSALICIVFLLLSLPIPGQAESSDIVRVELVVFQHVQGRSDRWPGQFVDAFAALPDPQENARLAAWTARIKPDDARLEGGHERSLAPPEQALGVMPYGPSWPEFYVGLPEFSPDMEQAISRLQDSPQYRVLTTMAWLQPLARDRQTRPVRVRGTDPLTIDWSKTSPMPIELETLVVPPVSAPEIRYRLDGSLHLRQRQFRHVDLELVWSDPAPIEALAPRPETQVLVHRLNLSRPVLMDRLEYFDSSWLGVLVRVEEWQPTYPASRQETNGAP